MKSAHSGCVALLLVMSLIGSLSAADWPCFRGPDGSGVSSDTAVPTTWSDSENLKWKTPLPGPGASSPIVYGDRVLLTCYSGYGAERGSAGNIGDLKRHLVCVNRADGQVVWSKSVDAVQPEDPYSGMGVPQHGYASNTPVTDGEEVFVFFGKSGVLAFDFAGKQLWKADVGRQSSDRRWGSAASLLLYKDTVIVNASEESRAIYALDKQTGREVWKAQANTLEMAYNTPVILQTPEGENELVVAVPNEVWSLNPDTGKLNWYAEADLDGNVAPSAVTADGIVYAIGGYRSWATVAVRGGGKGDVTRSHVLWTSSNSSYIPSPVLFEGNLYWVSDQGIANCLNAETGKEVYRERLSGVPSTGRMGKPFYASAVVAGRRIYAVSRTGGTFVLAAKPKLEQLAHNRFESDDSNFNASPAVSDGQMFLRSDRFLYCIEKE